MASLFLTLIARESMAEQIKWYDRPGQWFRNVLYAPRALQAAPPALGQSLKGTAVSLDQYGEGVLLVAFWASWCSYCIKELPQLDQLVKDIADPRFSVLAVNVYDEKEGMTRWIDKRSWSLQYAVDKDGSVATAYAISPLPTLVLVDTGTRTILKRWEGYAEPAAIKLEINGHLQRRPAHSK